MVKIIESYEELAGHDKVATLDMGGTLVADPDNISTQAQINTVFGIPEKEEQQLYQKFAGPDGDLVNHLEYAEAQTEELLGRPNANISAYNSAIEEIIDEREIVPGADNFVELLQDEGYETVVVSSAPPAVTQPFAENLEVDKLYKWKDFKFGDNGRFKQVYVNEEAPNGKQDVVKGLQSLQIEVAHFGNGRNDKAAVETADAGIKQRWIANPGKAFEHAFQEARKL